MIINWALMTSSSGDPTNNILIGDAGGSMFDHSKGGNDTFTETAPRPTPFTVTRLAAFSISLRVATIPLRRAAQSTNTAYGDAGGDMSDHGKGGNDTFTGAGLSVNTFYGDAGGNMSGHAQGGNDQFQVAA